MTLYTDKRFNSSRRRNNEKHVRPKQKSPQMYEMNINKMEGHRN